MEEKSLGSVKWLEFSLFKQFPKLLHGVFLREGGASQSPYGSLNVAHGIDDDEKAVDHNLEIIAEVMGVPKLHWAEQVHGTSIEELKDDSPQVLDSCDAFVIQAQGIAPMIKHADCQPAILYDPKHHALAMVHAGWRGSIENIYAKVIEAMKQRFDSQAADLHVGIGPSIGPCHAEFKKYKEEFPESVWDFHVGNNHFDFWALSQHQLEQCGVLAEHIEIAKLCTVADKERFYSYRRDKVTGRHGTVALLI